MKSFAKILKYAAGYKKYAFINVFCNILSIILELLSLMLFIPLLNLLFNQETEIIATEPNFAYTKEFAADYFNYTMQQYIGDNDKAADAIFNFIHNKNSLKKLSAAINKFVIENNSKNTFLNYKEIIDSFIK